MRILAIDDEWAHRELIQDVLEGAGHSVVTSPRPDELLLRSAMMFDLVICDGLDGEGPTVLAAARDLGARTLLASGDDDLVDAELALGFPAIRKPFRMEALLAAVAPVEIPHVA